MREGEREGGKKASKAGERGLTGHRRNLVAGAKNVGSDGDTRLIRLSRGAAGIGNATIHGPPFLRREAGERRVGGRAASTLVFTQLGNGQIRVLTLGKPHTYAGATIKQAGRAPRPGTGLSIYGRESLFREDPYHP